jgi:hypothetical protein
VVVEVGYSEPYNKLLGDATPGGRIGLVVLIKIDPRSRPDGSHERFSRDVGVFQGDWGEEETGTMHSMIQCSYYFFPFLENNNFFFSNCSPPPPT